MKNATVGNQCSTFSLNENELYGPTVTSFILFTFCLQCIIHQMSLLHLFWNLLHQAPVCDISLKEVLCRTLVYDIALKEVLNKSSMFKLTSSQKRCIRTGYFIKESMFKLFLTQNISVTTSRMKEFLFRM